MLGHHKGIIHYTIGQRKGLGLSLFLSLSMYAGRILEKIKGGSGSERAAVPGYAGGGRAEFHFRRISKGEFSMLCEDPLQAEGSTRYCDADR